MSPNARLLWRPPTSPLCFSGQQHIPKRSACAGACAGSGCACAPAAGRSLVGGSSGRCHVIKPADVQARGQGLLIPVALPKQIAQVGQGSPAMRGRVAVLRANETFAPHRHAVTLREPLEFSSCFALSCAPAWGGEEMQTWHCCLRSGRSALPYMCVALAALLRHSHGLQSFGLCHIHHHPPCQERWLYPCSHAEPCSTSTASSPAPLVRLC